MGLRGVLRVGYRCIGGDSCGRPRCGRYVHSGTEISNPACSSGESCKPSVPLSAMNSVLPRSVTA